MDIRIVYFKKRSNGKFYHTRSMEEAITFIREGLEEGHGLPMTIESVDSDGDVVETYEVDVVVTLTPRSV
jgi:hypothetical protein